MSRLARMPLLWACLLLVVAGCADNPMFLKSRVTKMEQDQVAMSRQYQQLQDRANALDRDNQDKDIQLSQAKQQVKVSDDELAGLRDQLRSTTSQLAQLHAEKENVDRRVQALNASMQRQDGVTINPNNSFLQTPPAMNIAGAYVRRDGDVIRIEMPAGELFEPGSDRLRPGANNLITDAAAEIARTYPDQMIGVEGYTDNDPVAGGPWHNSHELSVARAMAVYDVLVNHTRLQGNQLFVTGHGSNHPLVSNATPAGKQRNRRVELVVYPDRKG